MIKLKEIYLKEIDFEDRSSLGNISLEALNIPKDIANVIRKEFGDNAFTIAILFKKFFGPWSENKRDVSSAEMRDYHRGFKGAARVINDFLNMRPEEKKEFEEELSFSDALHKARIELKKTR